MSDQGRPRAARAAKKIPKVLKFKINHNLFSQTWGSQNGEMGLRLGKNSHIFPFFFWETSLSDCDEERKHLLAGAQVTQFAGSKQESNFTDN